MYFTELKKVIQVVEVMFGNSSQEEINQIKEKFSNLAKQKAKEYNLGEYSSNVPLDSYMILRMLLEYYRNEKKAKQYIIKRLFNEFNGAQTN